MVLIGGVVRNANTNALLPFINCCLTSTLNCASTDGNGVWNATWGYEGVNVTFSNGGFYPLSVNFTAADIAYYPDYGINGYWKVVGLTPKPPDPPSSCFTGDTLVLMADGARKAISAVGVGDRVLSSDGHVNVVSGVERPRLGDRLLYGFDGGPAFVTAEHPFAAEHGWRCVDPWALGAEGVLLEVEPLRAGDRLRRVVGVDVMVAAAGRRLAPRIALRAPATIEAVAADADTVVYNLLLDGDHTYVAGGWVVHNKGSH